MTKLKKLRQLESKLKQGEIDIKEYGEKLQHCTKKKNIIFYSAGIKNLKNEIETLKKEIKDLQYELIETLKKEIKDLQYELWDDGFFS